MNVLAAPYRNRLLREAEKDPQALLARKKFWRPELWPHYLRLCDDVLFDDPIAALPLTQPAPELAAILCKRYPIEVNAADLMILAHSHLGSAYRGYNDLPSSDNAFAKAKPYTPSASPPALAQYLRRLAYLRIVTHNPECFPLIEEGLAIYKLGNLVDRHGIGEMLICRGLAYFEFNQLGRSFDDWTAALSHVELKLDPKPWYCAVHNLAVNAVEHGTDEQLRIASANLEPAQRLLNTFSTRKFAKLKFRWVVALIDARLGSEGHAEFELLDVRDRLADLGLSIEVGWLSIDLAHLYLRQGRYKDIKPLSEKTVEIFRNLDVEAKAREALDLWHKADTVDDRLLNRVRIKFCQQAKPIPSGIAA